MNLFVSLKKSSLFFMPLALISVFVIRLNAYAQELYVLDDGNSRIYKSDLANPVPSTEVSNSIGSVSGLAVNPSNGDLYYTRDSNGDIIRRNRDGSNPTTIASGLDTPTGLTFDAPNSMLYFVQNVGPTPSIYKVGISGMDTPTLVISGFSALGPIDVSVDPAGGKIYWTDSQGPSVRRANLDGSSEETLTSSISGSINGIAFDATNSRVYWMNSSTTSIDYVSTSGGFPTTPINAVTGSQIGVGGLEVVETQSPVRFYWTDTVSNLIATAVFGMSPQTLLNGAPDGVAEPKDLGLFTLVVPTPTPTPNVPTATPTVTPTPSATPTPIPEILTPETKIEVPPVVTVQEKTVTIKLLNFTSVITTSPAFSGSPFPFANATTPKGLTFRYDVKVTAPKKADNIRKLIKRNELTLTRLKPGNYSVSYTAIAYKKSTSAQKQKALSRGKTGFNANFKKVYTTNSSPLAGFTIN